MAIIYDFEDGLIPDGWTQPVDANAGFEVTSVDPQSGSYCLKSSAITHDQIAGIEVTKNCVAGSISFYRKTSTESGYDEFLFYIDGVLDWRYASGVHPWEQVTVSVSAGVHTFKWVYKKDVSESFGDDTIWIDNISIPESLYSVSIPITDLSLDVYAPLTSPLFIPSVDLQLTEQYPFLNYAIIPYEQLTFTENTPTTGVSLSIPFFLLSLEPLIPNAEQILGHSTIGITQSVYGITTLLLHYTSYHGTNEVIIQNESVYGMTASSLHDSFYKSEVKSLTHSIHESLWSSIGISSVLALHEVTWLSAGSTPTIGQHEVLWSSTLRSTTQATQEAIYGTSGLNPAFALHESLWASGGSVASVFSLHESSWTYAPSAMMVSEQSWQSIVATQSLHELGYESVDHTFIFVAHEARYRSNQTTPIINTGLIYARI